MFRGKVDIGPANREATHRIRISSSIGVGSGRSSMANESGAIIATLFMIVNLPT
jgi:hypothetical protein